MATLKIKESGSNEPAPKPATTEKDSVVDSRGRKITLRKINALHQSRITLGLGAEAAMNDAYMTAFVYPAAMVESIDGDEYGIPTRVIDVEAMLSILGDEGIAALMGYFQKKQEEKQASGSSSEDIAIKN